MSSPDIELLSTKRISLPHLGHFVRDDFDAGVRRYRSVIQEGNFIWNSLSACRGVAARRFDGTFLSADRTGLLRSASRLIYPAAAQC